MRSFRIFVLTVVSAPLLLNAQTTDMEQQYLQLSQRFEVRDKSLVQDLKDYLQQYPYTTFEDEVHFMTGVIYAERNAAKQSNKELTQVDAKRLTREHQQMLMFYRAYNNLMMGEYDKALVQFHALLNEPTYRKHALYGYSYCQYRLGQYDEALPGLIEQSQQKEVPYFLTQIYYHQHRDTAATIASRLLTEEVKIKDADYTSELHRILGEIYYAQGNYQEAADHLKLIRNHKDAITEQDYFMLANAYAQLGNIEQAKLSYQAAMQMGFNPAIKEEAMYNYTLSTAQTSTAIGESVEAFTSFLRAYPRSQHQAEIYQLMARAFMQSKNYKAALDALDSIAQPNDEMLLTKQYLRYQLATDAYAQGKMKYVLQWTDDLLNNPLGDEYKNEAYYFRAEANYQQRDFAAAQQDIATFINRSTTAQSPNYAAALYLDAYLAFNQQDLSKAQERFETYLQAAPPNEPAYADALNRLGDCAFNVRAFEKAISYYQQAVATNQATAVPYALFQQGYAEGLLHQYDKKINTLNTLVSRYPKSDYSAEALYQIARSYIQQDDITQALVTYQNLVASYPTSSQARPAHLEIAMLYRNQGNYDQAVEAYKKTIARYPAGEEAYAALNGIENIYVETNRIDEYLAYTKTLADKQMHINTQEDSLTFAAAEMQFMTNHPKEALPHYISLAARTGSRYQLPSAAKASQISLDAQDYEQALPLFQQYLALASSSVEREEALLGILTCAEELHNDDLIIQTASQLLSEGASPALTDKALYLRGTAYMRQQAYEKAITDLQPLAQNTLTAQGAEAQYCIAEAYFNLGNLDAAEAEIISFTQQKTQQQYWLAKALILLSDIYRQRGDDFQAQQYLLSLQNNYKLTDDDILTIVATKLAQIE